MSCDKWAYDPKICDDQICPGDCDYCEYKPEEDDDDEEAEILAARKGEE